MKVLKGFCNIQILFFVVHILLTLAGSFYYQGQMNWFLLFSLVYAAVLRQCFRSLNSPSSFFFCGMIWLGFFGKTTLHLLLKYPFVEPIGGFSGTGKQWDEALWISSLGALGFLSAKASLEYFLKNKFNNVFMLVERKIQIPKWYETHRFSILIALLATVGLVSILNIILGVNMSGLVAITVLPRPLNALIGWLLYIGFAIAIAQIIYWNSQLSKNIHFEFLAAVIESLLSSISVISRGLYLFHILPMILVYLLNRVRLHLTWRKITVLGTVTVAAFVLNSLGVTMIRNSLFDDGASIYDFYDIHDEDSILFDIQELHQLAETHKDIAVQSEVQEKATSKPMAKAPEPLRPGPAAPPPVAATPDTYSLGKAISPVSTQIGKVIKDGLTQVARLAMDRWIGIEGVLAVVSYPQKNVRLLIDNLLRVPKIGELDIFETIARSVYQPSLRYSFASIPGPVACFYYSGVPSFVFLGLFVFGVSMFLLDQLIFWAFKNPFLSAQVGFYFANGLAQFGISPRPLLISFFLTGCGLLGLFLIAHGLVRCIHYKENK
jgi:hypothetical protein